jgi:hypothetical protein
MARGHFASMFRGAPNPDDYFGTLVWSRNQ